jgi:hypothetical protein
MAKTLYNVGFIEPGPQSTDYKKMFLQRAIDHYQADGTLPEYLMKYVMEGVQAELDGNKPWPTKRGRKSVIPHEVASLFASAVNAKAMGYGEVVELLTTRFDTDEKTVARALVGEKVSRKQ